MPVGATMAAFAAWMAVSCLAQGCSRPMTFKGKEAKRVEIRYGAG